MSAPWKPTKTATVLPEDSVIQSNEKVAIVTGASRGIGAAIAERLAEDGFSVVVNYRGDVQPADELVRKIAAFGGNARAFKADVSDPDAVRSMFDDTEAVFGAVDVLVNNAGIMPLAKIADSDDVLFDRVVDANLRGTFNTLREAAKRLRSGGRIINLSSSVVGHYQPTYGLYAATKAAVEAITHVLAKELGSRQITVNALAPGPTSTELFTNGKSPEVIQHIVSLNPMGRLGTPEDVARAVSVLAGEDSAWISGQVVRANGGVI